MDETTRSFIVIQYPDCDRESRIANRESSVGNRKSGMAECNNPPERRQSEQRKAERAPDPRAGNACSGSRAVKRQHKDSEGKAKGGAQEQVRRFLDRTHRRQTDRQERTDKRNEIRAPLPAALRRKIRHRAVLPPVQERGDTLP